MDIARDIARQEYKNRHVQDRKKILQERVVNAVRDRRVIWDTEHRLYGKLKHFDNAFVEILREIRRTLIRSITGKIRNLAVAQRSISLKSFFFIFAVDKVKKTWHNIRKAYVKNYKRNHGNPDYQTVNRSDIDLSFLDIHIQRIWDLERAREQARAEQARAEQARAAQARAAQVQEGAAVEQAGQEAEEEARRAQRFQEFFDVWAQELNGDG